MSPEQSAQRVFGIGQLGGVLRYPIVSGAIERVLGLDQLEAIYRRAPQGVEGGRFVDWSLEEMELRVQCSAAELARIPERGGLVVVANHPFGGVEGLLLAHLLRRRRPDLRILANYMLGRIPELRKLFLLVDPWGSEAWRTRNAASMRAAVRHVRAGGVLAAFPAGEVAHYRPSESRVVEPAWQAGIGRLAQATRAPVLPLYFCGQNRPMFHAAGFVHPLLRTLMLPRELLAKRGHSVEVRVGRAVSPCSLRGRRGEEVSAYLRDRTEALRLRAQGCAAPAASSRE